MTALYVQAAGIPFIWVPEVVGAVLATTALAFRIFVPQYAPYLVNPCTQCSSEATRACHPHAEHVVQAQPNTMLTFQVCVSASLAGVNPSLSRPLETGCGCASTISGYVA